MYRNKLFEIYYFKTKKFFTEEKYVSKNEYNNNAINAVLL